MPDRRVRRRPGRGGGRDGRGGRHVAPRRRHGSRVRRRATEPRRRVGDRVASGSGPGGRRCRGRPTRSEALLAAGAERVVLGSAALADEVGATRRSSTRTGSGSIVGIEVGAAARSGRAGARPGRPAADGDARVARRRPEPPRSSSRRWPGSAASAGPTSELVRRVVRAGRPVLAAGGIARRRRSPGPAGGRRGRARWSGAPPSRARWTSPTRARPCA